MIVYDTYYTYRCMPNNRQRVFLKTGAVVNQFSITPYPCHIACSNSGKKK